MRSSNKSVWYDEEEAQRAIFFIEEYCRHVKGPLAESPLRLAPWQSEIVRRLFGCKTADGLRQYRFLWLEVPRKSGKSTLAAAIALYLLIVDPEPGAEIVVASGTVDQASVTFDIARRMVETDPDLSEVCKVVRRAIRYKDAIFRLVSSRFDTTQGTNVSGLILDDVQTQTSRDLHDLLVAGTAARQQPLVIYLAAAGSDRHSLAWQLHEYAQKVANGTIDDPTWLVNIFAASEDDDWRDPEVWQRVHPGLDLTIPRSFLEQEAHRARQTPGFVNAFRRLYLNVWTEGSSRWLDMKKWDACGPATIDPRRLRGRACRAGLDLSTTTDLSALVLVFLDDDGGYTLLPFAFCPNDTIRERSRRDKVDYVLWRDQDYLIATEGNTIDHAAIRRKILELADLYDIEEIAFDRWNASMLISQLIEDGLTCVPVGQGASSLNGPSRELERVVSAGLLRHGNQPVLRWCAGNAVAEMNPAGEIRPAKNKSIERIDLLSATLMGISRHVYNPGPLRRRPRPVAVYCSPQSPYLPGAVAGEPT